MEVALLSGGTGGAKLARGLLDAAGPERLTVIANTGDDIEVHGVHVSPDPDLVTYWLADVIDERGYGIRGDSWETMAAIEAAGEPAWFRLGDRDLELCRLRTERLAAGERLTLAHAAVVRAMGVQARVLPATDDTVRTRVTVRGRELAFQEFMILGRGEGPIEAVDFSGAGAARATPDALAAIAGAEAIVIGPSNPIASIAPILAVPGMREAIARARAPVVAMSPFVGGDVVKGPTLEFCRWAGIKAGAAGLLDAYAGLVDGVVADEPLEGVDALEIDTLLDTPETRRQVATATLEFARSLRG